MKLAPLPGAKRPSRRDTMRNRLLSHGIVPDTRELRVVKITTKTWTKEEIVE